MAASSTICATAFLSTIGGRHQPSDFQMKEKLIEIDAIDSVRFNTESGQTEFHIQWCSNSPPSVQTPAWLRREAIVRQGAQAKQKLAEFEQSHAVAVATANSSVERYLLTSADRSAAPSVREMSEGEEPSTLLKNFLYPISPQQFLALTWKKRALHIQWNSELNAAAANSTKSASKSLVKKIAPSHSLVDRMAYVKKTHLCNLNITRLLQETASDNIFVWMKPKESTSACSSSATPGASSSAESTALHSFELDASNPAHLTAAETLYAGGASLYFRSPPPMVEEYVSGFAESVGMNFAGLNADDQTPKGEIEVFLSRAGHVTDWHFDFMENFTLQLRGTKTWHLKRGTITHPLRGATPHYKNIEVEEQQLKVHALTDPEFSWDSRPKTRVPHSAAPTCPAEEYDTVVLQPGDCFYHPAGIWHRVECNEDSVSVNISLIATDWANLVCDGLRQKLWNTDEWRSGISIQNMSQARSYLSTRLDHLRSVVNSFAPEDFLPNALFLPRQSHYVIQNTPCTDENSHLLCARAALKEQQSASSTTHQPSKKQKKSSNGTTTASSAASASAASTPIAPLVISELTSTATFRVNPLCVLLRYDHNKKAKAERAKKLAEKAAKEQDRMEEEEEEEEDGMDEDEDDDEDGDAESSELDDGETKIGYVLHFSFGNESLESQVRVTIDLSESLQAEMNLILELMMTRKVTLFTWDEISRLSAQTPSSPNNVITPAPTQTVVSSKRKSSPSTPTAAATSKRRKVVGSNTITPVAAAGDTNDSSSSSTTAADRLRKLLFFLCQQGAIHLLHK